MKFNAKQKRSLDKLADVQAQIANLKSVLKALSTEEDKLIQVVLPGVGDERKDVVEIGDSEYVIKHTAFEREYLDQDKVKIVLNRLGKPVPMKSVTIETVKVERIQ